MSDSSKSHFVQKRTDVCVKVCRELYRNVHGREASIQYRKEVSDMKDLTLTFGEIVPQSFLQILKLITQSTHERARNLKFVDLGSGTGRACLCAALSPFGFNSVEGIELMPALHEQAKGVVAHLHRILSEAGEVVPQSQSQQNETVTRTNLDLVALEILEKLQNNSAGSVPTDFFANALTKRLGHKAFKATIKEHKSFGKYLKSRENLFTLTDDGKHVSLGHSAVRVVPECGVVTEDKVSDGVNNNGEPGAAVTVISEEASAGNMSKMADGNHSTEPDANSNITGRKAKPFNLSLADAALLKPLPTIALHCGDMFAHDWSDADVVYTASLLFSASMMETLTIQASRLRPGAWVVSLKPLLLEECAGRMQHSMELRTAEWYKMSWQMAKVYIYQVC